MIFNVPQFIDIEDKIVGPLTAKQLGWMAAAGVLLLIFWRTLDTSAFIIIAVIIVAIFGALAFYRPYNQSLLKFVMSSFYYFLKPRIYVWKRDYDNMSMRKAVSKPKAEKVFQKKTLDKNKLEEITKRLDKK